MQHRDVNDPIQAIGDEVTDDHRAGNARLATFVAEASAAQRPPMPDWHGAVNDALHDLERAVESGDAGRAADAALHARAAIGSLAGIWVDVDESDAIYRGES